MTPAERLAAALDECGFLDTAFPPSNPRNAARIPAADPDLAQDLADGQALRLLREALPEGATIKSFWWRPKGVLSCTVMTEWSELPPGRKRYVHHRKNGTGPTIAEAADACRAALP